MKKSLIALAVAGAVSAPAFAATSNVDVYGRLNVALSYLNDQCQVDDDPACNAEDLQLTSFGSRIGFKGSEDLGGGLKAVWQIESGIDVDEGTGTLASRNTFVGLAGGFGTVLAGKHDTPLKLVGRKVDLFGDTFADSRNILGGASDTRANNVIAYVSPSMGGFSVLAAWANDLGGANTSGDRNDNSAYNLSANYENGPLYVGFAYGDGDFHDNNFIEEHMRLAASYAFGPFKVVGQYDRVADVCTDFVLNTCVDHDDYDAWMLGGAYAMGAMTFKANYMEGELGSADTEQWAVGVDYALSKRTTLYALYVRAKGDMGINTGFPELGYGAGASDRLEATDDKISALSLGLAHNF